MREMETATIRSPDERGDLVRARRRRKTGRPCPSGTVQGSSTLIMPTRAFFLQRLNVLKIVPESGRVQEKEWGTLSRWKGPSKSSCRTTFWTASDMVCPCGWDRPKGTRPTHPSATPAFQGRMNSCVSGGSSGRPTDSDVSVEAPDAITLCPSILRRRRWRFEGPLAGS